jgi:D-sedoheptulose 7-phosphate isomerase
VIRFKRARGPLRALALTTDTSVLTAGANDFSFEDVFARQVEALGQEGDLLVLHSTSGESENLLRAAAARTARMFTVALLARGGGRLRQEVDLALVIPTETVARAQELHLAIGHAICERVDRYFAEGSSAEGSF